MRLKHNLIILIFLCILCYSCNKNNTAIKPVKGVHILDSQELPYNYDYLKTNGNNNIDNNGIPIFTVNDTNHYHPIVIAQKGLDYLSNFRFSNDSIYLDSVVIYANFLVASSYQYKDAYWFPYTFDFSLHGFDEDILRSPWYSAMAQGQILSLLVRLYEQTNDSNYLNYATKVFNSFLIDENNKAPCVIYIDDDGDLWLEEYPMSQPTNALNGFNFAIFGIYDYYRLNQNDSMAYNLLLKTLTTVKKNIQKFQEQGEYSYYCLKHKVQNKGYHYIHIEQLQTLYAITRDSVFIQAVEDLIKDGEMFEESSN